MGANLFIRAGIGFILLSLTAGAYAANGNHLINGTPVTTGTYTEVVNLTSNGVNCSATVVGPRTILTAAHCATDGATATFTIGGHTYSAIITRSALYPQNDHDLALGMTSEDIQGVQPASIGGTATVGLTVALLGYGCTTAGGGPSDGVLRMGNSVITALQDYDMVSTQAGGAALCFGDSGGPALVFDNGAHKVLGINSKGNIQDTNYDTRTDTSDSQAFFQSYISATGVSICGVNATCTNQAPVPTCTLTASPSTISLGQNVTLTLTAQNATSATVGGQSASVPSAQISVTPSATGTATYQASVAGLGGSGNCSASVSITSAQATAPTCTLTASPNPVKLGSPLTLQLTAQGNATSAAIDGGSVAIPSGNKTLTPAAAGTYTSNATVTGPGGSGTCTISYTVATDVSPTNTPNLAVVSSYCGENTLQTDIYTVCLAVIARDATLSNLQLSNAIIVNYRDLSQEVLPIINRSTEPAQGSSLTVIEDLTLYANGTVNSNNVITLDSRTARLTSNPATHARATAIPTSLVGRSIKGEAFSVPKLQAATASTK